MMEKPVRGIRFHCISIMAIFLCAGAGFAATIYVDDNAPNDPGSGNPAVSDPLENGTAEHPFDAIQEAIDAAVAGDTVLVTDGFYLVSNLSPNGKAITIRSQNGPQSCLLRCKEERAVVFRTGEGRDTIFDGFLINGMNVTENGAVYAKDSSPTIVNCVIRYALAAGIFCEGGSALLDHCVIMNNYVGIDCNQSTAEIIGCRIRTNGTAGIKVLNNSDIRIENCLIVENGRVAPSRAVYVNASKATLSFCTVAYQGLIQSPGGPSGIGIYCENTLGLKVYGSIVYDLNKAIVLQGTHAGVTVACSCVEGGYAGNQNISTNPRFDQFLSDESFFWMEREYHLLPDSPCVNYRTYPALSGPATDIDGNSRTLADLGCCELIRFDLNFDDRVDLSDLAEVARTWKPFGLEDMSDLMTITDRWLWRKPVGGPVLHFPLDGNWFDWSSGFRGILQDDPAFVDASQARIGAGAVDLDGNDGLLVNGYKGVGGTAPRTCMAWIQTTQPSGEVMFWGDSTTTGGIFRMAIVDGQLIVRANGGYRQGSTPVNSGQWVHVAAVLTEQTVTPRGKTLQDLRLFVNGRPETETTIQDCVINTILTETFRIGADDNGHFLTGKIDDVYLYDRELGLNEIRERSGLFVADAGPDQVIVWPVGSTTLVGRLAGEIVNGSASTTTCWSWVSGPGEPIFSVPWVGNTQAQFPSPGTYILRWTAEDGGRTSEDEVTVTVTSGLIGHWEMDVDFSDSTGRYSGTVTGDPECVGPEQARVGTGAVELDGDDSVVVNGFTGIMGTAARTTMAWIKTTGTVAPIVYWGDKNTAGGLWDLRVSSTGRLRLVAGGGPTVDGATTINTGQWVHVAAVLPEGGNSTNAVQLYVNGVRETEAVTAGAINTRVGAEFRIGANEAETNFFTGLIDDVRVYDRALTAEEIAELAGQ